LLQPLVGLAAIRLTHSTPVSKKGIHVLARRRRVAALGLDHGYRGEEREQQRSTPVRKKGIHVLARRRRVAALGLDHGTAAALRREHTAAARRREHTAASRRGTHGDGTATLCRTAVQPCVAWLSPST